MERSIRIIFLFVLFFSATWHTVIAKNISTSFIIFKSSHIYKLKMNMVDDIVDSTKTNELMIEFLERRYIKSPKRFFFEKHIDSRKLETNTNTVNLHNPTVNLEDQYFDKVRKLEYYIASAEIKSNIISDTLGVSTKSNSTTNLSIGLNLRVHRAGSQLSSLWTLRYQDYGFSVATDSIEKKPESLKIKQASLEFRATVQGKKDFHPVVSMGWGVSCPVQVNYTDSQKKEVNSEFFKPNDYIQPTLYTVLGIGLALEKKNFAITIEAILRVNGILIQTKYINHNNFEYSKYNEQSFGSRYFERSLGVSFRFF